MKTDNWIGVVFGVCIIGLGVVFSIATATHEFHRTVLTIGEQRFVLSKLDCKPRKRTLECVGTIQARIHRNGFESGNLEGWK